MKQIFKLLLLFSFTTNVYAQFPEDFNFLNHDRIGTEIFNVGIFNDQLIANYSFGIDLMDPTYELIRKFHDPANKTKLIIPNDSTLYHASWDNRGSDFGINNLTTFIARDSINPRESISNFQNISDVHDVTFDSTGGWWCLIEDSGTLLQVKDKQILNEASIGILEAELFTSCNYDIFLVENRRVFQFDGTRVNVRRDLPLINDILYLNDFNYILTDDKLIKYDCTLQNILFEWSVLKDSLTFTEIEIIDSTIYYFSANENSYTITKIDESSTIIDNFTESIEENETIQGFKMLTDSTHVIYGTHKFDLFSHNFYRVIDQLNKSTYPTVDISIDQLLVQIVADTIFEVKDSLIKSFEFGGQLEVKNNDANSIYAMNIYSNRYNSFFTVLTQTAKNRRLQEEIPPNSERNLSVWNIERASKTDFANMQISVPGANYRFLTNKYQTVSIDFTSSTTEQVVQEILLHPNPTTNYIEFDNSKEYSTIVLDSNGKIVGKIESKNDIIRLDVSSYSIGIYYLLSKDRKGNIKLGKFIKQ